MVAGGTQIVKPVVQGIRQHADRLIITDVKRTEDRLYIFPGERSNSMIIDYINMIIPIDEIIF